MTSYPNDHIVVLANTKYNNRGRIYFTDMNSDATSNRVFRFKMKDGSCPKTTCLSMSTSEYRSITVVDKGSYEEVWIA